MTGVTVVDDDIDLSEPTLLDGLPGLGLVGKIASDYLVETREMTYYASLTCPGLPPVVVYADGDRSLRPPVRLYADEAADLVVLQSDVPVSPTTVSEFASCLTGWIEAEAALPLYASGRPLEDERSLAGVATGGAGERLASVDVPAPTEDGVWSGPTGALLSAASERDLPALGVIVTATADRPDPEAAATLLEAVVEPIAGVAVDASPLRERAAEIESRREELARRMAEDPTDESSKAEPLRMFQ